MSIADTYLIAYDRVADLRLPAYKKIRQAMSIQKETETMVPATRSMEKAIPIYPPRATYSSTIYGICRLHFVRKSILKT